MREIVSVPLRIFRATPERSGFQDTPSGVAWLVVGESDSEILQFDTHLAFVPKKFSDLGPELQAGAHPEAILTPVIGSAFDASEVADVISRAGYQGDLYIFAVRSGTVGLVRDEIARIHPNLRVMDLSGNGSEN